MKKYLIWQRPLLPVTFRGFQVGLANAGKQQLLLETSSSASGHAWLEEEETMRLQRAWFVAHV